MDASRIKRPRLGLSPLARGNLASPVISPVALRPIPARAGEPRGPAWCGGRRGAYPRSRGGTELLVLELLVLEGLSPLARGNHVSALIK